MSHLQQQSPGEVGLDTKGVLFKAAAPRKGRRFCKMARIVKKNSVAQCAGQRKLSFSTSARKKEMIDDFQPIFGNKQTTPARKCQSIEEGRGPQGVWGSSLRITKSWLTLGRTCSL